MGNIRVGAIFLFLSIFLCNCGSTDFNSPSGGGGGGTGAIPGSQVTTLSTTTQASQVASATAQSRELILTSTLFFKDLADIGLGHLTSALTSTPTVSVVCSAGGSYSYSGTYTAPSTYSLSVTFNGCRYRGFQYVGDYQLTGTPSNFTVALGGSSTFNIFNFDQAYTVLLAYLKANMYYSMTSSGTPPVTSYAINASGYITSFDYFLLNTFSMTMNALRSAVVETTTANLDISTTIVTNGGFSENWLSTTGSNRAQMTFANFTVNKTQVNAAVAPATSYTTNTRSIDGRVNFSFTPSTFGYGGLYDIVTSTPIQYSNASPLQTTQGRLTTNGTATTRYNAGSDVDIIVSNLTTSVTSTQNFTNEYNLMKTTDFAAMEQDKPPLLGPTSVSSVTDSTMAVTLTWYGGETSDMDTHMEFYTTTTPTSATTATWHVYYATGKTCSDPVGLSFTEALDINGDGTCDVGLDFDDTEGYGPEHITALLLQTGYYKIYIHKFSMDADPFATMYSSVHVGDNIFGPYSFTFTPINQSYFRIADVRVNANGTVDVLAPDVALFPF